MTFNSLSAKIGSGFLIVGFLFSTIVGIALYLVNTIADNSKELFDISVPINTHSENIQKQISRSLVALQAWKISKEQEHNNKFVTSWENTNRSLNLLSQLVAKSNDMYTQKEFTSLESNLTILYKKQIEIRDIVHTPDNRPGMQILIKKASPLAQQINEHITAMIENEMEFSQKSNGKQLLKNMADFRGSMANGISAIRGYLLTNQLNFKTEFERNWALNEASYGYLSNQEKLLSSSQKHNLSQVSLIRDNFIVDVRSMFTLRESDKWDVAEYWMKKNVLPLEASVNNQIGNLVAYQKNRMATRQDLIKANHSSLQVITVTMLLIGLALCSILTYYITKLIVKPLTEVIHLANNISSGDLSNKLDLKGSVEIERLSLALQNMVDVLRKVTDHANAVAEGNYQQDFVPQSESDHLGKALNVMTIHLRQADQQNTEQNWLKTGQSGMGDCLRICNSIDEVYDQSISYLCRYFDAKIGALYVKEQNELCLVSSFAYQLRSSNDNVFAIGEGMIGQAAKERTVIVFDNVPDEHMVFDVNSGLGDSPPKCILVLPLLNQQSADDEVVGVIAIGFNQSIKNTEMELLKKLSTGIALAITSAQSQLTLRHLLEESQQQTEQLKEQQDELSASNAELEEQAMNLSQAEEELRSQREDLLQSNEALREKTEKLELNNEEIEYKNKAVEATKKELEKRAFELEQASKYKSEFLANMSHELRTPLNSLLILSQIMAENKTGNLTDEQVSDIQMIHGGGESLLTLINDILDLSKVEAGQLQLVIETIDVHQFRDSLLSQFSRIAKNKGIEFTINITAQVPHWFKSDIQRVEQILRNLISNAIKFTESGQVIVTIEYTENSKDNNILYNKHQDTEVISFSVTDSGIGIPIEKQTDIFEAFQQGDGSTSRKFGGTGLGLTISRELSRLLGAEITLSSEEGKGSTFTLYLPIEVATNAGLQSAKNKTNKVITHNDSGHFISNDFIDDDRATITDSDNILLIVEDDRVFAKTLRDFAHDNGFKSLVTNKGIEALELVMTFLPHAVILDLGLSDMDGLKVLEGIKHSPMTKDIPVHIITAQDRDNDAIEKGAISFLSKPASVEDLNTLFSRFMEMSLNAYRHILLVEDDEMSCHAIRSYLEENHIAITSAHDGLEGLALLKQQNFDCIVLDLNLKTMSGKDWLDQALEENDTIPPVIIYTGKDLSNEEFLMLQQYTNSIVIKGDNSPSRLKDEVTLFLYDIEKKRKAKRNVGDELEDDIDDDMSKPRFKGKKVLVVDDDIRNVYALSKVLKEYGMEVIIADNGELALNKLDKDQGIDLILMDIMMPKMDGYEAIKHIRKQYKNKHPIIALTAKAMCEDRENCINAGANDYLAKPVDINQLVSMVKVWLYQ